MTVRRKHREPTETRVGPATVVRATEASVSAGVRENVGPHAYRCGDPETSSPLLDDERALPELASRAQVETPKRGPYMVVRFAVKDIPSVIDTGATLCLMGNEVYDLCREKNICVRGTDNCMNLAAGSARAEAAVRLQLSFDGRKRRQRLVYLPSRLKASSLI